MKNLLTSILCIGILLASASMKGGLADLPKPPIPQGEKALIPILLKCGCVCAVFYIGVKLYKACRNVCHKIGTNLQAATNNLSLDGATIIHGVDGQGSMMLQSSDVIASTWVDKYRIDFTGDTTGTNIVASLWDGTNKLAQKTVEIISNGVALVDFTAETVTNSVPTPAMFLRTKEVTP
jgi:hypothetical protein